MTLCDASDIDRRARRSGHCGSARRPRRRRPRRRAIRASRITSVMPRRGTHGGPLLVLPSCMHCVRTGCGTRHTYTMRNTHEQAVRTGATGCTDTLSVCVRTLCTYMYVPLERTPCTYTPHRRYPFHKTRSKIQKGQKIRNKEHGSFGGGQPREHRRISTCTPLINPSTLFYAFS